MQQKLDTASLSFAVQVLFCNTIYDNSAKFYYKNV